MPEILEWFCCSLATMAPVTQKTVASLRMAERCVYKQYTRITHRTDPSPALNYFPCNPSKFIVHSPTTRDARRDGRALLWDSSPAATNPRPGRPVGTRCLMPSERKSPWEIRPLSCTTGHLSSLEYGGRESKTIVKHHRYISHWKPEQYAMGPSLQGLELVINQPGQSECQVPFRFPDCVVSVASARA